MMAEAPFLAVFSGFFTPEALEKRQLVTCRLMGSPENGPNTERPS